MEEDVSALHEMPAAQIDACNKPIYAKDEQTVLSVETAGLSGKNADCLFQIRITGQQRANWRIHTKDCKSEGKHI